MNAAKHLLKAFMLSVCINASAEVNVTFNFHDTMSLTPSVNEPGLKQGVALDGCSFTANGVGVSFSASDYGNTHVRLYHSYDAGVDLRLYDGDAMTVNFPDDSYVITEINFTMSLSGATSGSNDINFIPSHGIYGWETETWAPANDDLQNSVTLISAEQSRIYSMTVTLDNNSGLRDAALDVANSVTYYNLLGRPVSEKNLLPGIYIRKRGTTSTKIIIR